MSKSLQWKHDTLSASYANVMYHILLSRLSKYCSSMNKLLTIFWIPMYFDLWGKNVFKVSKGLKSLSVSSIEIDFGCHTLNGVFLPVFLIRVSCHTVSIQLMVWNITFTIKRHSNVRKIDWKIALLLFYISTIYSILRTERTVWEFAFLSKLLFMLYVLFYMFTQIPRNHRFRVIHNTHHAVVFPSACIFNRVGTESDTKYITHRSERTNVSFRFNVRLQ